MTFTETMVQMWVDGGWMVWPVGGCAAVGLIIIVWELIDLRLKGIRTRTFLREVDALLTQQKLSEALALSRESNTPAGNILAAGLERHDEGPDRVMKAIENVRSEEHTSELQSRGHLVCRLLLEKTDK